MRWRHILLVVVIIGCIIAVAMRLLHLHVVSHDFLKRQGDLRSVRSQHLAPKRGMITDRHGDALAVSVPVRDIWVDPKRLKTDSPSWPKIIRLLQLDPQGVAKRLQKAGKRQFMYLKRQVPPPLAKQVLALKVRGVHALLAYRRYYPEAAATVHLLGVTNIDHQGQEGLEGYYNRWLSGTPGKQTIVRDLLGQTIAQPVMLAPVPGKTLSLSIDRRIQAIAYQALKRAVEANKAASGSAVIIDVRTGEVLAMVSQPAINPNDRQTLRPEAMRNRAVTDTYEPGSTMKPFGMTAVLKSGQYALQDRIDTAPGRYWIGKRIIRDSRNNGELTLSEVIKKSSNVGISKLVLSVEPTLFPETLRQLGFGRSTMIGFPGEQPGTLVMRAKWHPFALATLAFGYGIAVTTLQLAHAYATLANHGQKLPLTLLKRQGATPLGEQVVSQEVADMMLQMLEGVVADGGTGVRAQVAGYRVAGKTGTARKAVPGGYADDSYVAIFAGIIPADDPRLAMVVMVDDPRGDRYYGGSVAAPVFAETMKKVMPILLN